MISSKEILVLIILLIAVMVSDFLPTGLVATSATIADYVAIVYEEIFSDMVFQISMVANNSWYSYNTSQEIKGGYDLGNYSTHKTEFFTVLNGAPKKIDVTLISEDFSDGDYIDVDQTNGNLQIFIPNIGWRNVPDNSSNIELCIANDLSTGNNITGFDFRIRANNIAIDNYTAQLRAITYSEILNPCSQAGEYVIVRY